MLVSMLWAHLVGDYVLQWDDLAQWKSRDLRGVGVHGFIVTLTTLVIANSVDRAWWPWALALGLSHTLIDVSQFWMAQRLPPRGPVPLLLYLGDQVLHLACIALVLYATGYLSFSTEMPWVGEQRTALFILGYTFISMPAWVLIEFFSYGLAQGRGPDFREATRTKYTGILERGLVVTFVCLGQAGWTPLALLPRLLLERPSPAIEEQRTLHLTRSLISLTLAMTVGLLLARLLD